MSKTIKIIVSLVVIVLILLAGVVYFYFKSADIIEEPFWPGKVVNPSAKTGDVDLDSLLSSLDQEQAEETELLRSGDANVSALTDNNSLLDEINQTYQNEL